ncbi:MAG TPA: AI-2E family transporter [Solirubrobacteraceae bacterium]|nr:AI-2E family transporter [Solirubrobacteraceae bacterium]
MPEASTPTPAGPPPVRPQGEAPSPAINGRPLTRLWLAGDDAVPHGIAVASAIALRLFVLAGALYALGIVAGKLLLAVLPVVVGVLLATLLTPLAGRLRRAGARPTAAAAIAVAAASLVLLGLLGLVIPAVVSQLAELGSNLEAGTRKVARILEPLGVTAGEVDRAIDRAIQDLESSQGRIVGGVVTGAVLVTQWAAAALLTLVLTFFFVKDGARLWDWVVCFFSDDKRPFVSEVGHRAWDVLSAYVRGVVIVAVVDALLIGIALVVLGVPLAVPLIVLTFLAAFFPIVGAVLAGAAAVLVALVVNGFVTALVLTAVIVGIQQLEGNVLYPVVVGRRLSLHPVAILLALTAGGILGGVAGAFLAVPVAAVGAAVLEFSREHQRRSTTVVLPDRVP